MEEMKEKSHKHSLCLTAFFTICIFDRGDLRVDSFALYGIQPCREFTIFFLFFILTGWTCTAVQYCD